MPTRPLEALNQVLLLPFQVAEEVWRFLFGSRREKEKGDCAGGA